MKWQEATIIDDRSWRRQDAQSHANPQKGPLEGLRVGAQGERANPKQTKMKTTVRLD